MKYFSIIFKRCICLFICILFCFSSFNIKGFASENYNSLTLEEKNSQNSNGLLQSSSWDGSTLEPPVVLGNTYYVDNGAMLAWISSEVGKGNSFSYKTIILRQNIDLGNKEWTPIGSNGYVFAGTFDGNGYTISNFRIRYSFSYAGLFGRASSSAVIKNVTVNSFTVGGWEYAGGLIGYNQGTIENCTSNGQVIRKTVDMLSTNQNSGSLQLRDSTDSNIKIPKFDEKISVSSSKSEKPAEKTLPQPSVSIPTTAYLGGLAGFSSGTIKNSSADGNLDIMSELMVSGNYYIYIGGFIGYNSGNIQSSNSQGDVNSLVINSSTSSWVFSSGCGGFVGYNSGTISSSSSKANVIGSSNLMGGFAGSNYGGTLAGCYSSGSVTPLESLTSIGYMNRCVGGFAGYLNGGTISQCYSTSPVFGDYIKASFSDYYRGETGGLIGRFYSGTLRNSYALGNVNNHFQGFTSSGYGTGGAEVYTGGLIGRIYSGTTQYSYAANKIVHDDESQILAYSKFGGIVGYNSGSVSTLRFDNTLAGEISPVGAGYSGGSGYSTEMMKQASSYPGWDFNSIWKINGFNNNGYPYFDTVGVAIDQVITLSGTDFAVCTVESDGSAITNATAALTPIGSSNIYGSAKSGSDGIARISNISNGGYVLTVNCPGYDEYKASFNILGENRSNVVVLTAATPLGTPYISSALINEDNKYIDILHSEKRFSTKDEKQTFLNVTVNWNGTAPGKVYLTQGKTDFEITDNTDICSIIGSKFEPGKTIYLYAISGDGDKKTSKLLATRLLIYTSFFEGEFNEDNSPKVKLFKDLVINIPQSDSLIGTVFGGGELKIDLSALPAEMEVTEDTINIAIGIGGKKESGEPFKWNKYFKDGVKDALKNAKLGAIKENWKTTMDQALRKVNGKWVPAKARVAPGFEFTIDTCGYIEIIKKDGEWVLSSGGILVNGDGKYSVQQPVMLGPVPGYYELGGGCKVDFSSEAINITAASGQQFPWQANYTFDNVKWTTDLKVNPYFIMGGGVGIAKVVTVGIEGELGFDFLFRLSNEYRKGDFYGAASFAAKALGFINYKKEFARGTIKLYEYGYPVPPYMDGKGIEKFDIYDISGYTNLEPRAYKASGSRWLANSNIKAMPAFTSGVIKSNTYPDTVPVIGAIGNKIVAAWIDDDTSRSDINRTVLMYSVYDLAAKLWSSPKAVSNDGTADYFPVISGNYITWQNIKSVININDYADMNAAMTDVVKKSEICAAYFDGTSFTNIVSVTDNMQFDTTPQVASYGNMTSFVWMSNDKNDLFGLTGSNIIKERTLENGVLSAEKIVSQINKPIINFTSAYINGKLQVVYAVDTDGNTQTVGDHELYLNGKAITSNKVIDSNPQFFSSILYWNQDGKLISRESITGTADKIVLSTDNDFSGESFQVMKNTYGDNVIIWTDSDSKQILASYLCNGTWSKGVPVVNSTRLIKTPSAYLDDQGSIFAVYNESPSSLNEQAASNNLMLAVAPMQYDISLDSFYIPPDMFQPNNELPAYFTVSNMGTKAVEKIKLSVGNYSSKELQLEKPLLPGEKTTIESAFSTGISVTRSTITGKAELVGLTDADTSNNSKGMEVGKADIALTRAELIDYNDGYAILTQINNRSSQSCENVVLSVNDEKGNNIYSKSFGTVEAYGCRLVKINVDINKLSYNGDSIQYNFNLTTTSEEDSIGNNSDSLYMTKPTELEKITINPASVNMVVSDTYKLNYKTFPEGVSEETIRWSSDKSVIASVSSDGTVTANRVGIAVITASSLDGSVSSRCVVAVLPPNVTLKPNYEYRALKAGENTELKVVTPEKYADIPMIWYSSNPYIASVSNRGLVTAVSQGAAYIVGISEDYGLSVTSRIDVYEAMPDVISVKLLDKVKDLNLQKDGEKIGVVVSLPTTFEPVKSAPHMETQNPEQGLLISEVKLLDPKTNLELTSVKVTEIVDDRYFVVKPESNIKAGTKITAKVIVHLKGYLEDYCGETINFTITNTVPKITSKPVTLDLYNSYNFEMLAIAADISNITTVEIDGKADKQNPNPQLFELGSNGSSIRLSQTTKAGSYSLRLLVSVEGFINPIPVAIKITVKQTIPALKFEKMPSIDKNNADYPATVKLVATKGMISSFGIKSVALANGTQMSGYADKVKQGYLLENSKLYLTYDPEDYSVRVSTKSGTIAGAIKAIVAVTFSNSDCIMLIPFTVTPADTPKTYKYASSSIKLNTRLTGSEGLVKTAINTTVDNFAFGQPEYYINVDNKWILLSESGYPLSISFSKGEVAASINGFMKAGKYKVRIEFSNNGVKQFTSVPELDVTVDDIIKLTAKPTTVKLNRISYQYDAAEILIAKQPANLNLGSGGVIYKIYDSKIAGTDKWRDLTYYDYINVSYGADKLLVKLTNSVAAGSYKLRAYFYDSYGMQGNPVEFSVTVYGKDYIKDRIAFTTTVSGKLDIGDYSSTLTVQPKITNTNLTIKDLTNVSIGTSYQWGTYWESAGDVLEIVPNSLEPNGSFKIRMTEYARYNGLLNTATTYRLYVYSSELGVSAYTNGFKLTNVKKAVTVSPITVNLSAYDKNASAKIKITAVNPYSAIGYVFDYDSKYSDIINCYYEDGYIVISMVGDQYSQDRIIEELRKKSNGSVQYKMKLRVQFVGEAYSEKNGLTLIDVTVNFN